MSHGVDKPVLMEFMYNDTEYFISRSGSSKYVSLWEGKTEQSFDTMTKLVEDSNFNGNSLLEIWAEVEIATLF